MGLFALGFILGGLFGAGIMALLNARKADELEDRMKYVQETVTPKPTECEDAIDRQALKARFNHLDEVYEGMSEEEKHEAYIYGQIIRAIDDAPTIIPATKMEGENE